MERSDCADDCRKTVDSGSGVIEDRFDLIVVGAGPSGSMAAFHAARAGLDVLILDKASFPRVKPCAGGLTVKATNLIPFSIADVVETQTETLKISLRDQKSRALSTHRAICSFVVREKLDQLLLDAAIEAGARFETIGKITSIDVKGDHGVSIGADADAKLGARYLVAADGANSKIRRLLPERGLRPRRGFAIEGVVPYQKTEAATMMELSFGVVGHGYGWLFPKRDHVNIGLYTCTDRVSLSKAQLFDFSMRKLGTRAVEAVVGFPMGFGGETYSHRTEPVLFVGDAGGFCEPLLGEGLHNAIKSGLLAGRAVAEAIQGGRKIGRRYSAMLRGVQRDLALSKRTAFQFFYPNLDTFGYRTLTFPLARMALMHGFASGRTFREIVSPLARMPVIGGGPSIRYQEGDRIR